MPSRWPRRLLWLSPLLPLLLAAAAAVWQGQFLAERALRLVLGEGSLSHSLVLPSWDGTLRLDDLRFGHPDSERLWLTAERVHIRGASAWWLLRNALRQERLDAPIYQLGVRFEQVRVAPGLDPALGDLAPIGLSGAPFESLGCPSAVVFNESGLIESELAFNNQLDYDYSVAGSRLDLKVSYQLEDSAGFERQLQQALPMQLSLLVIDQYPLRTLGERWLLSDDGFSRVRHKRCAARGDMIALVDRHVELVRQASAALGLAASEDAWASYRRYVRDGGQLSLTVRYPTPAPLDGWFDRPRSASLLALSEAVLSREDQRIPFTPADAYTDGLSGNSPKSTQPLALGSTLWLDPEQSLVLLDSQRGGSGPGSSAAPASRPEPDPLAVSTAPARPGLPAVAPEPAPDAAPATPRRGRATSAVPRLEGRLVIVGEQRSRQLDWGQLEGKVGKRVRITTQTGATRVAELVAWSDTEITVRSRLGGGMAESRIQRSMFREAVEL